MSRRVANRIACLRGDRSGVAMLEFGLMLPVFMGFVLTGMEFANWVMANNRTQRMASMTADLVAQSGIGAVGTSEAQIYDLFAAVDLSAKPFDLRNDGRIVISSVKGTDTNNDGAIEKRFLWQRFDGNYVAAPITAGCATSSNQIANLPGRALPLDEILYHVQVTYNYQPLFSTATFDWLNFRTAITRTATFRARTTQFQAPSPDSRFPPKSNCRSANGL